jgi:hypothetical protein
MPLPDKQIRNTEVSPGRILKLSDGEGRGEFGEASEKVRSMMGERAH